MRIFQRNGIRFEYPGDWQLQTEPHEDSGWTVTISSPDIAFVLVSMLPDVDDAHQVADEALSSLKSEYAQLESTPAQLTIANHQAIGYDIDFISVDHVVFAQIRVIDTIHGCLLILMQTSDQDRSWNEPVMNEILESVKVDD